MKLDRLKKSVGWLIQIMPPACHLDGYGNSLPEPNEEWQVEQVTDHLVRLSTSGRIQLKLGTDHIHSFATNPQHAAFMCSQTLGRANEFPLIQRRLGRRSSILITQQKVEYSSTLKLLAFGFNGLSNPS